MKEITFEITNYCPHKCDYCSSNTTTCRDKSIYIDINIIKQKLEEETYDRINISGGEPLSHPNFYDILELCKSYAKTRLYTNAIPHILYNANVLDGIYVEANLTVLPEIDEIHILRRVKQGREKNRPEVHLSRNFQTECSCDHRVILPNGTIAKTPCNKFSILDELKKEEGKELDNTRKIYITGSHGVGKTTLINDLNKKFNVNIYKNETSNPYSNDIKRRQLWRLYKYKTDEEILKTYSNDSVLVNRCCLDWLVYTTTFKKLGWIASEDFDFLIKQYKELFENALPEIIIFLNPPLEWSKERLLNRWKEENKKWREDDFNYYEKLREEYNSTFSNLSQLTKIIEIQDTEQSMRINKVKSLF